MSFGRFLLSKAFYKHTAIILGVLVVLLFVVIKGLDFYTHQGQAERIKKFPLPRQYGSMSFVFVGIFIFLLPFGLVTEFHDLSEWGAWLSIPFSVIVSWVFLMMELVGDYSENPFEGLGNDIPMLALCRTIEIDLLEMLGETELPPSIQPVNDVLM